MTSGRGKVGSVFSGKIVFGKFVLISKCNDRWLGHSLWWLRPSSLCSLPNHIPEQAISTKLSVVFLQCLCLDFCVVVIVVQCPALFCFQDLRNLFFSRFFMFVAKSKYAWDALKEVLCVLILCVWGSVIVDLCIFPTIEIFSITCSCVFVFVIVLLCL